MSFSRSTTLRPVNWSEVDSHGKNIRQLDRARSESPSSTGSTSRSPQPPNSPPFQLPDSDSDLEIVDPAPRPSASTSAISPPPVVVSAPPIAPAPVVAHNSAAAPAPVSPPTSSTSYPLRGRAVSFETPIQYYPPALSPSEMMWRDRYGYLFQKGYQIRPRYSPTWNPMSRGNSRHYHSGEDHFMQILPQVLDGIRRKDGLVVCIKMISEEKKLKQIAIIQHFGRKPRLASDSSNHVVPFYDTFPDVFYKNIDYIVTPVLRRFDDPPFAIACEVVDFVTQMLEGLVFMHENNVAHHNIIPDHIMMDAKSLIPTGWHFISHSTEPDGMTRIKPLDRKNHPVRYYYIGFGKCYHIQPRPVESPSSPSSGGAGSGSASANEKGKGKMAPQAQAQGQVQGDGKSLLVMDIGGDDGDVPELFTGKPYDPYKMDVYTLGNVFLKEFYQKFGNLGFLADLVEFMRNPSFEARPTSQQVLKKWHHIWETLDEDVLEDEMLVYRPGKQPKPFTVPDVVKAGASASASASASGGGAGAGTSAGAGASGSRSRGGGKGSSSRVTSNSSTSGGPRQAQPPGPSPTTSKISPTPSGQLIPIVDLGPPAPVPIPVYYYPHPQQSGSGGAGPSTAFGHSPGPQAGGGPGPNNTPHGRSGTPAPSAPAPGASTGPSASKGGGSGNTSAMGSSVPPNAPMIPFGSLTTPQQIPLHYLPPPPPIPLYSRQLHMHPYPQPYPHPYSQSVNVGGVGGGGRGRGEEVVGSGGAGRSASSGSAMSPGSSRSPSGSGGGGGERERQVEKDREMAMAMDVDEKDQPMRDLSAEPFRERKPQMRNIRPKNVRLAPGSWR